MSTYEIRACLITEAGLDHKLILLEGREDPVGKEDVIDALLVVSSDPFEDLSD